MSENMTEFNAAGGYSCTLPPPGTPDVWERIEAAYREGFPVVLYGTGDGADRIAAVLEGRGIVISGCFASDGFVRNRSFRGHTVHSFDEIKAIFPDGFVTILAFATALPEVMDKIDTVAEESACFFAPHIPATPDNKGEYRPFTRGDYDREYSKIAEVSRLLWDERSRALYAAIWQWRMTGELCWLRQAVAETVMPWEKYRHIVDLGAYTGDTARFFAERCPNLISLTALEPDRRSYAKLSALELPGIDFRPIHAAAWDKRDTLTVLGRGGRGMYTSDMPLPEPPRDRLPPAVHYVDALPADEAVDTADLIKLDVEGAEMRALSGAKRLISDCRLDLLMSVYHRSEDLFMLPLRVHEILPEKRLRLLRPLCYPDWDVVLAAAE